MDLLKTSYVLGIEEGIDDWMMLYAVKIINLKGEMNKQISGC